MLKWFKFLFKTNKENLNKDTIYTHPICSGSGIEPYMYHQNYDPYIRCTVCGAPKLRYVVCQYCCEVI